LIKLYNGLYYTEEELQKKAKILEQQSEKSLPACVWMWRIWHDKAQELMKQVARHKN
jgi:hypothetical protein